MSKEKLVSGITATGELTIGNYIGAIRNFVKLQDEYDMYIFVADLHALTIDIEPNTLRENRKKVMALYVASGLDPKKVSLFYQSEVSAHGEVSFIIENFTTIGELSRMTQYKDKSAKQKEANGTEKIKTGLLTYPTLMAGDILLYKPTLVPVGIDQKQHLELTRNIAIRFNNKYGDSFPEIKPYISKEGAKIMSLSDPTKKMSKSDKSAKAFISLLDDPDVAAKKIMKAVTDSENNVYLSDEKAGIKNLLTIYSSLENISLIEAEEKFKGCGYGEFKTAVADVVREFLKNLQSKYEVALSQIDEISKLGREKANIVSQQTLKEIKEKIGL